jgi:hypothetical protein
MMVQVPGPFAICFPHSSKGSQQVNGAAAVPDDADEAVDDAPDDEEDEEEETNPEIDDDDDDNEEENERRFTSSPNFHQEKFVVRNEFGHIRLQHLLEGIENSSYGENPNSQWQQFEVGGHCVLPEKLFQSCIAKGWGQKHVLSGRYHPIAGTVIPETTLLFTAPRNEEELEIVWNILKASYDWALSDVPTK